MSKRHADALAIQQGACNPSGIARSLVAACDEARAEGKDQCTDAAVRLIVHQLQFLCEAGDQYIDLDVYGKLTAECEQGLSPSASAAKRVADRIDGYDRDDLGESPDY